MFFLLFAFKCLPSVDRKKAVAGKDNMTCTGTPKKYHLCNTKVTSFSSLLITLF